MTEFSPALTQNELTSAQNDLVQARQDFDRVSAAASASELDNVKLKEQMSSRAVSDTDSVREKEEIAQLRLEVSDDSISRLVLATSWR
jgi:predicted  nucleic acid-binding Zn-ribbon protein